MRAPANCSGEHLAYVRFGCVGMQCGSWSSGRRVSGSPTASAHARTPVAVVPPPPPPVRCSRRGTSSTSTIEQHDRHRHSRTASARTAWTRPCHVAAAAPRGRPALPERTSAPAGRPEGRPRAPTPAPYPRVALQLPLPFPLHASRRRRLRLRAAE